MPDCRGPPRGRSRPHVHRNPAQALRRLRHRLPQGQKRHRHRAALGRKAAQFQRRELSPGYAMTTVVNKY